MIRSCGNCGMITDSYGNCEACGWMEDVDESTSDWLAHYYPDWQ